MHLSVTKFVLILKRRGIPACLLRVGDRGRGQEDTGPAIRKWDWNFVPSLSDKVVKRIFTAWVSALQADVPHTAAEMSTEDVSVFEAFLRLSFAPKSEKLGR